MGTWHISLVCASLHYFLRLREGEHGSSIEVTPPRRSQAGLTQPFRGQQHKRKPQVDLCSLLKAMPTPPELSLSLSGDEIDSPITCPGT
mmetsp:Transcript_29583/g.73985  ORF Transcript_29583/g.73985 Transcript_29583/m.73985 type:complete len:89 (-) Transcript_29583:1663-1929(-)